MDESLKSRPAAPVGSLVLIALMYIPWLTYFFGPRASSGADDSLEFPLSVVFAAFGLGYLVIAFAVPVSLYRHRSASSAHRLAFYASVGILALCIGSVLF